MCPWLELLGGLEGVGRVWSERKTVVMITVVVVVLILKGVGRAEGVSGALSDAELEAVLVDPLQPTPFQQVTVRSWQKAMAQACSPAKARRIVDFMVAATAARPIAQREWLMLGEESIQKTMLGYQSDEGWGRKVEERMSNIKT